MNADDELRKILLAVTQRFADERKMNTKETMDEINALFDAKFEACLPEKKEVDPLTDVFYLEYKGFNEAIAQTRDNWYKG